MELEEEYKKKLIRMNQKIAQSLLEELQVTAKALIQKTHMSAYNGADAISMY